jgi:hypothetical protein
MKLLARIFLAGLLGAAGLPVYAQQADKYVYPLNADTVTLYKDNAEFIIGNSTKSVNGYLYNKGKGRTEFRKLQLDMVSPLQVALIGQDTLELLTATPQPEAPYVLPATTCQTWNNRKTIFKSAVGDVYLKLDPPSALVDDIEIVVANISTSGSVTIYTNNRTIKFGYGQTSTALKLNPGMTLHLIYDVPTDMYFVIGNKSFEYWDDTLFNVNSGSCPQ